jgi:hypothetical protein
VPRSATEPRRAKGGPWSTGRAARVTSCFGLCDLAEARLAEWGCDSAARAPAQQDLNPLYPDHISTGAARAFYFLFVAEKAFLPRPKMQASPQETAEH